MDSGNTYFDDSYFTSWLILHSMTHTSLNDSPTSCRSYVRNTTFFGKNSMTHNSLDDLYFTWWLILYLMTHAHLVDDFLIGKKVFIIIYLGIPYDLHGSESLLNSYCRCVDLYQSWQPHQQKAIYLYPPPKRPPLCATHGMYAWSLGSWIFMIPYLLQKTYHTYLFTLL